MNNGKYNTEKYKKLQAQKTDRQYGELKEHTKVCKCCGKDFIFEGRIKTKAYERKLYCSRSCANNRQEWWDKNATNYRTIAFQDWKKECAICGFDKIVAVHHIDEDHSNNNRENLIPLCPNHHEMVHSKKYNAEVNKLIGELVKWDHGSLARSS